MFEALQFIDSYLKRKDSLYHRRTLLELNCIENQSIQKHGP